MAHYAARVLRLGEGAPVELFDGQGKIAHGTLRGASVVVESLASEAVVPAINVAAPLLKGERQDWMIEKMCELGAGSYTPLVCERAQFRELSENKRQRHERIAQAAARQSGRAHALIIGQPQALFDLPLTEAIVLDPAASDSFAALWPSPPELVIVGPEGGFSESERQALEAAGVRAAKLGRFVLRAETAVIAALSVAATFRDR